MQSCQKRQYRSIVDILGKVLPRDIVDRISTEPDGTVVYKITPRKAHPDTIIVTQRPGEAEHVCFTYLRGRYETFISHKIHDSHAMFWDGAVIDIEEELPHQCETIRKGCRGYEALCRTSALIRDNVRDYKPVSVPFEEYVTMLVRGVNALRQAEKARQERIQRRRIQSP
jgi:hypothetical protein